MEVCKGKKKIYRTKSQIEHWSKVILKHGIWDNRTNLRLLTQTPFLFLFLSKLKLHLKCWN